MRLSWAPVQARPADQRWLVLMAAGATLACLIKLSVAASTYGSNDVTFWSRFADGVRTFGPAGIYGHPYDPPYNHPPLAGLMLETINMAVDSGLGPFPFLLRVPACIADVVTTFVIFRLLQRYHPPRRCALIALAVTWSPVTIVISGYHGNWDSVFIMFALLAVYTMARGQPLLAGGALAAGISIKLVPVILGPVLLVSALRGGRREAIRFVVGGAIVAVPIWGYAVGSRWDELRQQVFGYVGISLREWGLIQALNWIGAPDELIRFMAGTGRFGAIGVSAALPCVLLAARRLTLEQAAGLAMVLTLLLSPAFGMQYLVWPLAMGFLLARTAAAKYNVVASCMVIVVYSHWSEALPWQWYAAASRPFAPLEFVLMVLVWTALANVAIAGARTGARRGQFDGSTPAASWLHRGSRDGGAMSLGYCEHASEPAPAALLRRRVRPVAASRQHGADPG